MQIVDDLNEYVNDHIIYKIVVSHNDTSYLDKVAEVIKKKRMQMPFALGKSPCS